MYVCMYAYIHTYICVEYYHEINRPQMMQMYAHIYNAYIHTYTCMFMHRTDHACEWLL